MNDSEFDILWFSYKFKRDIDRKGRPCTNYYGGDLSVILESTDDMRLLQQMVHKKVPAVNGSIEVLAGSNEVCLRRIEFKEAYFYYYCENMQDRNWLPMTTAIAISPIRLDFNNNTIRLDRKWPRAPRGWQKYVEEEVKHVKKGSTSNAHITDVYWIDDENNQRREFIPGMSTTLYIVVENLNSGETISFTFKNSEDNIKLPEYSGTVDENGIVAIENYEFK